MRSHRLRDHARRSATALLLVATGCASPPPGTDLQALSLDLAFGVKKISTAPANFAPPLTVIPPPPDLEFPDLGPIDVGLPCPTASVNSFPAEEAGLNIDGFPQVGAYRWKRNGTLTLLGRKLNVSGFESRAIRGVRIVSEDPLEYTFQTVQDELSRERVVTTFTVKPESVQTGVNPPLGVAPPVRAGEPERGISLTKVETYSQSGEIIDTFEPVPGILLLPLPVSPGEQWRSHGVDPVNGATLDHMAQVIGRKRVDACGDVVDGWLVKSTEQITDPAQGADPTRGEVTQRTYDYIIAPQLGGILISEHVDSDLEANTGTKFDLLFELGQLVPSPLPKELQ